MTTKIYSPHDHTFCRLLADKRVAEDFFKQYLPEKIRNLVNFDELELCKDSFIDEELKKTLADVLYKTLFQGKPGYLFLLVEHQSTADPLMPFRLLKYCVNILDRHQNQHPQDPLPFIYPIVFFHGKETYSTSTDLFDLFGEHKELAKETFLQPFHLIDVNKISDEDLRNHLWSGTLSFVFKHIYAREMWKALEYIKTQLILIEQNQGDDFLVTLLQYIFNQAKKEDAKKYVTFIQETLTPTLGGKAMLLKDYVFQQGRQEGKQEGKQEGIQQGLEQGIKKEKRAIALRLLAKGENIETIAKLTDLKVEEIKALFNISIKN